MHLSRRSLLTAGSWAGFAQALKAAPGPPEATNEAYWALVKRQFPLAPGLTYLNAANVCPASRPVLDRHAEYLRDFEADPSFQNREKYAALRERLRGDIARLLRAAPNEVTITRNTSEGNNLIVQGLSLKAGDEVVVTTHNHPSNLDSWKVRAAREGFAVREATVPVPAQSAEAMLNPIEKVLSPRTKVVSITHLTSTTGNLYPVRAIADITRGRGIWLHLDGAQTFGALDVNLAELGPDSYTASAHKWPMGPLEAGILFVRAARAGEVWPAIVSAGWRDDLRGGPRLEVFGQRDDPRLVAFQAAIDFLELAGVKQIESRVRFLARRFKEQAREIRGCQLKTSLEDGLSGGVVKVALGEGQVKRQYDALWERHRIALAPTFAGESEGLRFSPHIYNSVEEIDRTIEALRRVGG